jgi:O-Antigen ligase
VNPVSGAERARTPAAATGLGAAGLTVAAVRRRIPELAGWVLPFAIVVVLALENGGYDVGIRSEVGIAVWWIVLVGVLSGMLALDRIDRGGWIVLGLAGTFAVWTGIGIAWSESAERSVIELARVATYAGILVLGLTLQSGADALRRTVSAVGCAIALVGGLALLSRLHPAWFPDAGIDTTILGGSESRLNYPLNYWNGLAALTAIGIPLLLTLALRARSLVAQALAAAAVPMLALTAFYTLSRGGAVEIAIAIAVLVALHPRRLAAAPTLLVAGAGSAILIAAATQRDALEVGAAGDLARQQGDEMLAMTLVVCTGVALLAVAIGLARRYGIGWRLDVSRRWSRGLGIAAAIAAIAVAIGPADLPERWDEFRQPGGPDPSGGAARFESVSGNGRYQAWEAAVDANASAPVTGIGPGTYEFWWAREGELGGFVRDAHSLYLETLGELGVVGLALVLGLVGSAFALGVRRTLAAAEETRSLLAGAVAACAAFAAAAAVDWVWELAVLPAAFFLLLAAIAGTRTGPAGRPRAMAAADRPARRTVARAAIAAASVAALVAIAIPYTGATAVSDSAAQAREAQLAGALDEAETARRIQPYAGSPHLQQAFLRLEAGDLGGAAAAAREATAAEATNWRTWLVLSGIEARRGNAEQAVEAYRRARSLNPRSPLFATGVR